MQKLVLLTFLLVLFLSTVFGTCISSLPAESSETKIQVAPPVQAIGLGATFDVNVTITNAENVYSWQFVLSWDPTILDVQDVVEGSFLNQRIYKTIFQDYVNNEAGNLTVVCVLRGEPRESSANGNGTLATVTFNVKDEGYTLIHLQDTMLLNYDLLELSHATEDGIIPEFPTVTLTLFILIVLSITLSVYKQKLLKTHIQ